jgi:hypothetical protein
MRACLLLSLAAATIALCELAPLRHVSSDTVPGRLGGVVLRCAGTFDLTRVDWFDAENRKDIIQYYVGRDHRRRSMGSIFGPGPAVVMSVALVDYGEGDTVSDASLRRRERGAAAVLVGVCAVLLAIACRARTSWRRSMIASGIAVLSFAGAATSGQGLWQATVALPALMGGLALVAWRDQRPGLALGAPGLLLAAVMLRPNTLPLALGIGALWALTTRDRKSWLVATALALAAVAPFVVYNAWHFNSPVPLGQWHANKREVEHVFGVGNFMVGLAGLVVSPGRGVVWFAPVALLGAFRAPKPIAFGLAVQLVLMATFFKWHGGQAYGPRLLVEAVWIAMYGACTLRASWLAPTAAITIIVGQLGLWCYRPEQWEARRLPDSEPAALWDFRDNPIFATMSDADPRVSAPDSPAVSGYRCQHARIYTR